MISNVVVLVSAAMAVRAMPSSVFEPTSNIHALQVRAAGSPSTDGICGAFNGSSVCVASGFGPCCSQFGYCGSSELHCGTGCQTGFGSCGNAPDPQVKDLGCFTDSTSARVLPFMINLAGNTPTKCSKACDDAGFAYSGVEFGSQCWCGSAPQQPLVASAGCTMDCAGDSAQKCGGSNAIRIFSAIPTWQNKGCYSDATNSRTLSVSLNLAGNTNKKCQDACAAAGYKYSGTEFGSQCFCGNTIDNNGAAIAATSCNKPCAGDSTTNCGGSNALSLFLLLGA